MKRLLVAIAGAVALAAPAAAEGPVQVSLGYSFVKYLDTGGGSAPVGAFFALSGRKSLTLELDLGWQHYSEPTMSTASSAGGSLGRNTLTVLAGPKINFATRGSAKPFVHVLGGLHYDTSESNTSPGGVAGGGVDIKAGKNVAVRLFGDFQLFSHRYENLEALRLGVGLSF